MNFTFMISFNLSSNGIIDEINKAIAPFIRSRISFNSLNFCDIDEIRPNSKMLREEINNQLNEKLVVAKKTSNEKQQLQKKIAIFEKFIARDYFDSLKKYRNITMLLIKQEIRQTLIEFLMLIVSFEDDVPLSTLLSSSLINHLISMYEFSSFKKKYSSFKKFKLLFKSKRIFLTVVVVQKDQMSIHATARMYETSRKIIKNRFDEKRIMTEFSKHRQLFSSNEETIIFRLIDSFAVMEFSVRLIMLKEKILFFFKRRCKNSSISLRQN